MCLFNRSFNKLISINYNLIIIRCKCTDFHYNYHSFVRSAQISKSSKNYNFLQSPLLLLNNNINHRNFWGHRKLKPGELMPGVKAKDVTIAGKEFKEITNVNKESFLTIIDKSRTEKYIKRHGYVEFITAAMSHMKEFGVHKDLDAYKALINVFPRDGRFKPKTFIASGFGHYILHQRCAVDLLDQMNYYNVMPDGDLERAIIDIFSKYSDVWRKCARMNYWMAKLKNTDPFPIPEDALPMDSLELAILAMKRMCVDVQTKISVYSSLQVKDSIDKTWIVSAQSPAQKELIDELSRNDAVYVEGPFRCWLRHLSLSYFVLRANADLNNQINDDDYEIDDVSYIPLNTFGGKAKEETMSPQKCLHIQDDGKFLSLCATGTSSRDSLLSWIRILQQTNENLKNLRIIFTLKSPATEIQTVNESKRTDYS